MSRYDWDSEPRLDERRISAPDTPRHGRKKKTRRWCKGKVGVEHQLEIILDERVLSWMTHNGDRSPCYRPDWLVNTPMGRRSVFWSWMCSHVERCTVCGKIFEHALNDRCPNYTDEITIFKDVELQKLRDATRAE